MQNYILQNDHDSKYKLCWPYFLAQDTKCVVLISETQNTKYVVSISEAQNTKYAV